MTDSSADDARAHERIEKALGALGSELAPPVGWEARVLAGRRRVRAWWRWTLPLGALAAAALLLLWLRRPTQPPMELALELAHAQGEPKVRSAAPDEVHLGDTVHLSVRGGEHRALWLYLDSQLLLACPGDPACKTDQPELLRASWQPRLVGRYTVLALSGKQELPKPSGSLDADLSAALRAKVERRERVLEVR